MKKLILILSALIIASMLLAACGTPATTAAPADTQAPAATAAPANTMAPADTATTAPTAAPADTATALPPTPVAAIPDGAVTQKGRLTICSDLPYPPMEFFDENGNPTGSDIELGQAIAGRLGLQLQVVNSVFDTIIAAASSGKCDIVLSDMNITPDRNKQISFIPYFQAGQSMLAVKGNPENINAITDLCGKNAAAESGTTEVDYLQGSGDYKGKGLPAECTKAGKPNVNVVVTQKDTDALQQLQASKVSVYFADTPVAAYYVVQHPDQFQLVGQVVEPAMVGIGVICGQPDCTKAPLSPLGAAVDTALKSLMADGTYAKILAKWNLSDGAIKP